MSPPIEGSQNQSLYRGVIPYFIQGLMGWSTFAVRQRKWDVCIRSWWFRHPANQLGGGKYLIIYMVLYIQTVVGNGISEPSTVSLHFLDTFLLLSPFRLLTKSLQLQGPFDMLRFRSQMPRLQGPLGRLPVEVRIFEGYFTYFPLNKKNPYVQGYVGFRKVFFLM